MLQKTQWALAALVLTASAYLIAGARPAQAQVRIHLTRGMVVNTTQGSGIILPPSSPGIVIPSSSPVKLTPPSSPPPPPTVKTPPPTNIQPHIITLSVPTPPPAAPVHSAPQGFSAGPSLLFEQRLPLGKYVDRVGPDIIGDNGPTVQKVIAHH
jgi:hypothetical protein